MLYWRCSVRLGKRLRNEVSLRIQITPSFKFCDNSFHAKSPKSKHLATYSLRWLTVVNELTTATIATCDDTEPALRTGVRLLPTHYSYSSLS
eukprot:6188057-Pleurochrysis_carterae.AAC.2